MDNSRQSRQILLSVIGVAILVVAVVGVSFAFFNYTRTGPANTIGTGEIHFTTSQSTVAVTNLFPIAASDVTATTPSGDANVAVTTVTIEGWTNYAYGLTYTVTAEAVDLKGLPIKVKVFKDSTSGSTTANATLTQYDSSTPISSGATLATGTIAKSNSTPQSMPTGTITIKAYIDAADIIITDTPADDSELTSGQVAAGYDDGTVTTGKTRVSTATWNALASTPATFKVKVVSNEGHA